MSDKEPLLQQQPTTAPPPQYDYQPPPPQQAGGYGGASQYPQPAYPPPPQPGYPPPQAPPYPQAGYQHHPQAYQPPHTVAMGTQAMYFGSSPIQMVCPHCQTQVMTNVSYEAGTMTWLAVGFFFILGFFVLISWCLCWLPLMMDGLKDIVHTCPNCNHVVGTNRRM